MATETQTTTMSVITSHQPDQLNDLDILGPVTEIYGLIISDAMMFHINLYFFVLACGAVSIFGTITNVLNMIVFYRLGIPDSMSFYLFAMSFTDFLLSLVIALIRVFYIWNIFYKGIGIDPLPISYVGPAFLADGLFLCSGWILTLLSLERCVCVTFPFEVRQIFTKKRSIVAVVAVYVVNMSSLISIFATQGLGWEYKVVNGTLVKNRLIVVVSDNREKVKAYEVMFSSVLIPIPALIITFVSVLWMVYGLTTSSKIRHSMTSTTGGTAGKKGRGKHEYKLDHKTRKLVVVVLILAIIFLFCSIPRIIGKYVWLFFPHINERGRDRNLNNVIWQVARFASSLNGCVNIFIYLKINSAYRQKFADLLPNCLHKTN